MNCMLFRVAFILTSFFSTCYGIVPVRFTDSLLKIAHYDDQSVSVTQFIDWHLFGDLYERHIITNRVSRQGSIPKIIHHIWLGSPLPERCKRFIRTWQKKHPTWKYMLWDDAKVAALGLVNRHAYRRATNYGEKSDIVRYEILYRFGGLYVDTDFECLHAFDELHDCCDFYIGAYLNAADGSCYVLNSLIGSVPGHPVLYRCITGIQKQRANGSNTPEAIIDRTGPLHVTRCLKAAIESNDQIGRCVPFPPTYFFPLPATARHTKDTQFIKSCICPESLAVHHWACSWM